MPNLCRLVKFCVVLSQSNLFQGSEYRAVVVMLQPEHDKLLFRSLLYTSLTRARQLVIFISTYEVLARAAANTKTSSSNRRTLLSQRIQLLAKARQTQNRSSDRSRKTRTAPLEKKSGASWSQINNEQEQTRWSYHPLEERTARFRLEPRSPYKDLQDLRKPREIKRIALYNNLPIIFSPKPKLREDPELG